MKRIYLLLLLFIAACNGTGDNATIEESGTIETTDVIISAQIGGVVDIIKGEEGDKVKRGDTLLVLNHEALNYQLQQAEAQQKIAEAQLSLLVTGSRKEDIKQTFELLNQSKLNLNLAEADYNRMKNLYSSQAITKKQYDDAETKYEVTKSQVKAAEESYNKIKNIARPEEIAQAKANYEKAVASVGLIKKSINDCFITSPIDGVIVKKFNELGEYAAPLSSLFKVSDLTKVELVVYVSETELAKVKLGQQVEVKNDSYPEKVYKGKVTYISPESEFTPKNIQTKDERTKLVYSVKIVIPNKNYELKSGMPADATIYLSEE